jgi:hypothetical protein
MRLLPFLIAIAAAPLLCNAQDDSADNAIHATTTLHADGTRTVTITDPEKHSSEAATYDAGNRLIHRIVYTLDDNNRPSGGIVYSPTNQPVFKTAYKHDDFNRVTEEDDYTMDDQLMRRFIYEFGPDGKVIRIRAYDGQGNELQESSARRDESQVPPRVH